MFKIPKWEYRYIEQIQLFAGKIRKQPGHQVHFKEIEVRQFDKQGRLVQGSQPIAATAE